MTDTNDNKKLRDLFKYQLRSHVSHQDGRDSLAPSLVFADADYEVGDGTCGLHSDAKSANEPAIVFVRADSLIDALDLVAAEQKEIHEMALDYCQFNALLDALERRTDADAQAALEARDARIRNETLDAASEYLKTVYGNSPLSHPVDRNRILAMMEDQNDD